MTVPVPSSHFTSPSAAEPNNQMTKWPNDQINDQMVNDKMVNDKMILW